MVYVTADQVERWEKGGVNWTAVAFDNMRRDKGENPATHENRDENGKLNGSP